MMNSLPPGWTSAPLEQVAEVLDNLRQPVNNSERAVRLQRSCGPTYPYYGATGKAGEIDDFIFDDELVLLGEDGVPFLDASKPKAYHVSGKCWVNNHAHVLRVRDQVADWRIVCHALNTLDYSDLVSGSTRLKLTQEAMRRIELLLPPRREQRRIADKLDAVLGRVDACRDRLDRVGPILQRFRRSVLDAAVSGRLTQVDGAWARIRLGELIAHGPTNGLYKPAADYGSGTRIVRIDMFYDGELRSWDTAKRLKATADERKSFGLDVGDILVNRVNSPTHVGKSVLIRTLPEPAVFESNMMRLTVDPNRVLPEYLMRFLCSELGLRRLRENVKHAVNQSSINQQDVRAVFIELPQLDEQESIVRAINCLFSLADRLQARLAIAQKSADRLTPALLAKAFRGELVQQDPADEPAQVLLERLRGSAAPVPRTRRGGRPATA